MDTKWIVSDSDEAFSCLPTPSLSDADDRVWVVAFDDDADVIAIEVYASPEANVAEYSHTIGGASKFHNAAEMAWDINSMLIVAGNRVNAPVVQVPVGSVQRIVWERPQG